MAGCLDGFNLADLKENFILPDWLHDARNSIASYISGAFFGIAWWLLIDAHATDPSMNGAFYVCGVVSTLSLFMVNALSTGAIDESGYGGFGEGFSPKAARAWLLMGFILLFSGIISSAWIMFADYIVPGSDKQWTGIALFLQNVLIFLAALIFKFGRVDDES
eukprot:Clim_evm47s253 gene=Clim_evmTU47s253